MALKRYLFQKVVFAVPMLLVLVVMVAIPTLQALASIRTTDPQGYAETFGPLFGEENRKTSYDLDLSDPKLKKAVDEMGLSAQEIAETKAAIDWVNTVVPNAKLTLGISSSIYGAESVNGTAIGNVLASTTTCPPHYPSAFCAGEKRARDELLPYWQAHHIIDWDPVAKAHIIVDAQGNYVDYTGGGAGEVGPDQQIASTLWRISCPILQKSSDSKIASCSVWDERVSTFGKMALLAACGYNADASLEDRVSHLTPCWNADRAYVTRLVERADAIDLKLNPFAINVNTVSFSGSPSELDTILTEYKWVLVGIGIYPEEMSPGFTGSQQWASAPLAPEDNLGITSPFGDHRCVVIGDTFSCYNHGGTDFGCHAGALVRAVAAGKVILPKDPSWVYNTTAGYPVWIDHGGIYTGYFHMISSSYGDMVHDGQLVEKGQPIGHCGSTGDSTGPHVHLDVRTIEPGADGSAFNFAGIINPADFLGTDVDPAVFNKK